MRYQPRTPSWMDLGGARRVGRVMAIYGVVGVLAALGAALLMGTVDLVATWVFDAATGVPLGAEVGRRGAEALPLIETPGGRRWWVLVIPTVGGLLAGLIISRWAPETSGGGVGLVIRAYHREGGKLRKRVPLVKFLASVLTMGSGGSAGGEGPIAQIGAGLASIVGGRLGLGPQERRILLMTGMAAGIGAAFKAPLAGALFAAEVLYADMDFEQPVLVPAILTSTVAYGVYGVLMGWTPVVALPPTEFGNFLEIIPYTVLAILLGVAAIVFTKALELTREHIGRSPIIKPWLRPAVGGLAVGAIGLFIPSALGKGYGLAQAAIDGTVGPLSLLLLAIAKMAATTLTVGSGGSGGKLSPSLVLGAALGGFVGLSTQALFPELGVQPATFAIVGMAGFFAAASNTPVATVFLVSAIAGTYTLLVPSIWVCAIAWLIARRYRLFPAQVTNRLDAPPQLSEMMAAVLRKISVRDAMPDPPGEVVTLTPETPMPELLQCFAHSTQAVFPIIVGPDRRLIGVVDGKALRQHIGERGVEDILIAQDFLSPAVTVTIDDTLYDAIARMTASGYTEELLVIDDREHQRLVGLLSRRQVIAAYYRRMLGQGLASAPETSGAETWTQAETARALARAIERGGVVHGVRSRGHAAAVRAILEASPARRELNVTAVVRAILAREALSSTAVGDGIALPHPGPDAAALPPDPVVIVATLERPLPWDAPDSKPVDIVAIVLCKDQGTHLKLLGGLARALSRPELREALRHKAPADRVVALVEESDA